MKLNQKHKIVSIFVVIMIILILAGVTNVWLKQNNQPGTESQRTVNLPYDEGTSVKVLANLLVQKSASINNTLEMTLDSPEATPLSAVTVELRFDRPAVDPTQIVEPFQLAPSLTQSDNWLTPVNRFDCTDNQCTAQLAIITLNSEGAEMPNEAFALITLPTEMTDKLNTVTIDTDNTVVITKDDELVVLTSTVDVSSE